MTKPNSAEFGYFYACCPIIWTLLQFLFTIDKNYDTLTSERDIANGAIPFLVTGTCSNNRNLHRSRCKFQKSLDGDFMIILKAIFWVMFLPFKLLFWWLPTESDSYDKDDEEYLFWKEHGHDW